VIITKDICVDVHPGDEFSSYSMSIPDLAKALSAIKEKLGRKIDIVGMDACLMNMLEVAYEIKDTAAYMVGSENTEPEDGWPYDTIFNYLKTNVSSLTAEDLAREIVQDYIASYGAGYEATQSAIDLSEVGDVAEGVNQLASALIDGLNNDDGTLKITLQNDIFNDVQRFDDADVYDDSYADLHNLASLIKQKLPTYATQAQAVMDGVNNAVIANSNTGGDVTNAYGLSIWFPNLNIYNPEDWDDYWNHYAQLSFVQNTQWDEFITKMWEQ